MFLIFFLSLGFKSRPELAIFSTFQPLSDLCQCLFHEIWNTHTKGWVEESWGSCSNQQIYILYIVQFWTFAFFSKFSREILKLSFYMIFYISIGSENHIGSAPNFFLNCNHGYELCGIFRQRTKFHISFRELKLWWTSSNLALFPLKSTYKLSIFIGPRDWVGKFLWIQIQGC